MSLKDFSLNFHKLLTEDFKGINLTRINNFEEFYIKQVEDSLAPLNICKDLFSSSERIIDLGFGGGFPILPLAFSLPDNKFIGLEARMKKVNVVTEISENLGLKNVDLIHCRYQDFEFKEGDLIVSKAMDKSFNVLNQLPLDKPISVVFYKGPKFFTEEENKLKTISSSWEKILLEKYSLSSGDNRVLLVYKNVPRGTN